MQAPAPEPPVARLFIGLWPPEDVRAALMAEAERWSWPRGARRVRPDKLHMTLHFLGAVPRERVAALGDALAAASFEAFTLHVDRAEIWSNEVASVRPSVVPAQLEALHGHLKAALDALGLATAREMFKAHVTLARRARRARRPAEPPRIDWPVRHFALMESMPDASYRILRDYACAPAKPGELA